MQSEAIYARILSRVDRAELYETCFEVAQKEARLIERRIDASSKALQHVYDVDAARKKLPVATARRPQTKALVEDIERIQVTIEARLRRMASMTSGGLLVPAAGAASAAESTSETVKVKQEPEAEPVVDPPEETSPPRRAKGKKRRLSQESLDSPRKPPRPGRLAIAEDDATDVEVPTRSPHEIDGESDDETEDEYPVDLALIESDTEIDLPAFLEKARRLRKISSDRRMAELPGLIMAVLEEIDRHEWTSMPRDLLGTLSATLSAATTLKPAQREQLIDELRELRVVALKIDVPTARRYPTLLGSKVRFLSSLDDLIIEPVPPPIEPPVATRGVPVELAELLEPVRCENIEDLHAATTELAKQLDAHEELKSMEELEDVLTLLDHVFDNPSLARSDRYIAMVASSVTTLINYVTTIPRTTRRKLQCEEHLLERQKQLTGWDFAHV